MKQLMQDSNDKGFAVYDDVSEIVPDDLVNGSDLTDFFADIEAPPVELAEEPKEFDKKDGEEDLSDVDLSPGALD